MGHVNTDSMNLCDLAIACYMYGSLTSFNTSLHFLKQSLAANHSDLLNPDCRNTLLKWLNEWGCRHLSRESHGIASSSIRDWYEMEFYQLMRLQLMGQDMEQAQELGAQKVSVLHICPEANGEFRDNVTSPALKSTYHDLGVLDIWQKLVLPGKFKSISVENMLQVIADSRLRAEPEWIEYLQQRYGW